MKRRVLIFGGGCYPAIQIYSCLRDSLVFEPVAASSYDNHSRFVFRSHYDNLPYISDAGFVDALNALISRENIEFIIPTDDTIALRLMEEAGRINAVIVCSPVETARLCRYKSAAYAALADCQFTPDFCLDAADVKDLPVFAKPDDGQGARGAVLIETRAALESAAARGGMVFCQYLPGDEYTVDCFTDHNGDLLFSGPRRRERVMYGVSARSVNLPLTEEFREIVDAINARLRFRGYWFVQLKRDANGRLMLLEICTRFAGTFGVSKSMGVNLPLLALCDFAGMDVEVVCNRGRVIADKTFIDRYELQLDFERAYVDWDDTVTRDSGKSVNPFIIALLYQWRAKGRRLVLITRHASTHADTLREHMSRLRVSADLFDEIIEIGTDEEKTSYMDDALPSIFLDNSFAERRKAAEIRHMPVFDVSNADCLFDWR